MVRTFLTSEEILARVAPYTSPRTGVIGRAFELAQTPGNPQISVYTAGVSSFDLGLAEQPTGTGAHIERDWAEAKAYCETLERYCNVKPRSYDFVVATRQELGDDAVDMELFPRCSEAEYRHPANTLTPPSNTKKMRWIQGHSLITGRPLYVPAMAVYVGLAPEYPGENFSTPISTGTALAAGYEQALITGMCEAIERDALSIAWWQKLALPQVDLSGLSDPEFLERQRRVGQANIQQYFFDATTDLGVATIYAVLVAPNGALRTMVMSATRTNPLTIPSKIMDEAAASRIGIEHALHQPLAFDPKNYYSFNRLFDGAVYYAEPATAHAFDFLFEQPRQRPLHELPVLAHADPVVEAQRLIETFRARQLEVIAVDLTLPVLREVGLRAIKIVAPQLMPFSCHYSARFWGTPRLYSTPAQMGYKVHSEAELNHYPQPFA